MHSIAGSNYGANYGDSLLNTRNYLFGQRLVVAKPVDLLDGGLLDTRVQPEYDEGGGRDINHPHPSPSRGGGDDLPRASPHPIPGLVRYRQRGPGANGREGWSNN